MDRMTTSPHPEDMTRYVSRTVAGVMRNVLLIIGALTTVISIAGDYSQGSQFLRTWLVDNKNVLSALLHLMLVVLVLFPGRIRLLNKEVDDKRVEIGITALNRYFLRVWTWMWVCFGLLYLVIYFHAQLRTNGFIIDWEKPYIGSILSEIVMVDVFNLSGTICFALCYAFLTPGFLRRYVDSHLQAMDKSGRRRANLWDNKWEFWIPIWMVLLCGVAIFCCGRWLVLDHLRFSANLDFYNSVIIGLLAAVAMGFLAGRMDSQFVSNWQWMIFVLYLYAALQAHMPIFYDVDEGGKAMLTYTAFTMKCLLYIFVSDFFESRRVVYYVHELVRANDTRV